MAFSLNAYLDIDEVMFNMMYMDSLVHDLLDLWLFSLLLQPATTRSGVVPFGGYFCFLERLLKSGKCYL